MLDVKKILVIDVLKREFVRLSVEDKGLSTLDDIMLVDTGT